MKKLVTVFLKVVIVLIAIGVLAGLVRFPQTEGRATNLDLISIYKDPFIIYIYIASISFFIALYQAFKLIGQISVRRVRIIKYCAVAMVAFIAGAEVFILLMGTDEDKAGALVFGFCLIILSGLVTIAAAVIQKRLQQSIS